MGVVREGEEPTSAPVHSKVGTSHPTSAAALDTAVSKVLRSFATAARVPSGSAALYHQVGRAPSMKREFGSACNRVRAKRSSSLLAEGVGFEPTVGLPPQRFSRPSQSSALAPLRVKDAAVG
jgi:hypothetical protein